MAAALDIDADTWRRLSPWLDQALDRPQADREAWLDRLPAEAAELRPLLQSLLNRAGAGAETGDLLAGLPRLDVPTGTATAAAGGGRPAHAAGDRIGPWRLLRELGHGGMGVVWLAERADGMMQRQVALKLPLAAGALHTLAERLARERDILATLEHPHIARLYDAGMADDGQPWLAMECVDGERIDRWCAARQLPVRERVALFLQVAQAVAHAHAKLVVHRDLKPSNILVTAEGQARLLDFGIARLLDAGGGTADADLTQQGTRALTPDYAAPEQLAGAAVTTRSDVYSLGVVLYELLAGARPYRLGAAGGWSGGAPPEVIDAPSRHAPTERRRALRGDLDTIVLKALKAAPDARYATVDALADDLARWLDGRPVLAQPDRAGYRLRRFVGRHRWAVGAGVLVLLATVGGSAAVWQQRQQALAEKRRAEDVKNFIASVFRDANPWLGPQQRPDAVQLLERAEARLDGAFARAPETRQELVNTLAESWLGMQQFERAQKLLRRALAETPGLPQQHPLRLQTRALLVQSLGGPQDSAETERELQSLLPLLAAAGPDLAEAHAGALQRMVQITNDRGDYAGMLRWAEAARAVADAHLSPGHAQHMQVRRLLANALENLQRYPEAVQHSTEALAQAERLHATTPRHPEVAHTRFMHGRILHGAGRSAEGLPLMQQSAQDSRELFGAESFRYATMLRATAAPLQALDRLDEARAVCEEALRLLAHHHAPDSVHFAYALVARGMVAAAQRDNAVAMADLQRALAVVQARQGEQARYTLHLRTQRELVRARAGDPARAAEDLAAVLALWQREGHPNVAGVMRARATALRLAGRPESALAALPGDVAGLQSAERARIAQERGLSLLALGRAQEALAVLAPLAEAHSPQRPVTPDRAELVEGLARARRAAAAS